MPIMESFSARSSSLSSSSQESLASIPDLVKIRNEFRQFGEGSLELIKDRESGIAVLALRNSGKKNCFSGAMMAQLGDVLSDLEAWNEGKALVIFGENSFFSSGGDLDTVRRIANPEGGNKMICLMQDNLARLQSLPLITVAHVEGMALGGGAELLTACDYRVAARNAVIGFVQVRVGITTVWGGGARLVSLIGYGKALNLIATGRTISGQEAFDLGLVDEVLPPPIMGLTIEEQRTAILESSRKFLEPFLRLPRETMLVGKLVAMEGSKIGSEVMHEELEHGLKVWGGPQHQKALGGKVNHKKM